MSVESLERRAGRLKLRELEVLRALAETGSMARAAQALHVTQSAISKIVSETEQTLGVPLVERLPRGVELTDSGRVLVARASVVFDEIREGVREIEALSDPNRGELRIGTTEAMAGTVALVIDALTRRHPGIRFVVEISDTAALVADLRDRRSDIVWTRWTPALNHDGLRVETLFRAPLRVLAHRDNPLVGSKKRPLHSLLDRPWTLSPPDSFLGRLVAEAFRGRGCDLPVSTVTTISIYMRLNLLATGHFLTVLPTTMISQPANRDWLRKLDVDLGPDTGAIALISLARRTESTAMRVFRATAKGLARQA